MNKLAKQLIKLGNANPELRKHLIPILDKIASEEDWRSLVTQFKGELARNLQRTFQTKGPHKSLDKDTIPRYRPYMPFSHFSNVRIGDVIVTESEWNGELHADITCKVQCKVHYSVGYRLSDWPMNTQGLLNGSNYYVFSNRLYNTLANRIERLDGNWTISREIIPTLKNEKLLGNPEEGEEYVMDVEFEFKWEIAVK